MLIIISLIVVPPELGLKRFHHMLIQLEGFSQNIRINGRIRPENGVGDGDDTRVLAALSSKGNCIGFSNIELEVNEPNWEHKHISLV